MKTKFYVIFFFFLFFYVFAQKLDNFNKGILTKEEIDKKLKIVLDDTNKNLKEKEQLFLALKAASEKINYDEGIFTSGAYLMDNYDLLNKNREIIELGNELKKKQLNIRKIHQELYLTFTEKMLLH